MAAPAGRRYFCQPYIDESIEKEMMADVKDWFKYYTVGFANYPSQDRLINPVPIQVNRPGGSGGGIEEGVKTWRRFFSRSGRG